MKSLSEKVERRCARTFLEELLEAQLLEVHCADEPPRGYDSMSDYMKDVRAARKLLKEIK